MELLIETPSQRLTVHTRKPEYFELKSVRKLQWRLGFLHLNLSPDLVCFLLKKSASLSCQSWKTKSIPLLLVQVGQAASNPEVRAQG